MKFTLVLFLLGGLLVIDFPTYFLEEADHFIPVYHAIGEFIVGFKVFYFLGGRHCPFIELFPDLFGGGDLCDFSGN